MFSKYFGKYAGGDLIVKRILQMIGILFAISVIASVIIIAIK